MAELAVLQAQANLDTAQSAMDVTGAGRGRDRPPGEPGQRQTSYNNTVAKAGVDQTISSRISLEQAIENLTNAQENYANAMSPDRDWEKDIETSALRRMPFIRRSKVSKWRRPTTT